jgi:hypothetical protein
MIVFNEELHKYTSKCGSIQYKSVTTVIGELRPPKNWVKIAYEYSLKNGMTTEYWLNKWDSSKNDAGLRGTRYHKRFEDSKRGLENVFSEIKTINGDKLAYDLSKLDTGEYIELICYDQPSKICGTADGVIINGDGTFDLYDHKTTKPEKMKFKSISYGKQGKARLIGPVSHIDECAGMEYTLQLSLYAYMIEKYSGLKCNSLWINHVIFKRDCMDEIMIDDEGFEAVEDVNKIELTYMKDEAKAILDYYTVGF